MGLPVGVMLSAMTSREFSEYLALWSLEPQGELRADFRAGLIAATVFNAQGGKMRDGRAATPDDFMPIQRHEREREKLRRGMSGDAVKETLRRIFGRKEG